MALDPAGKRGFSSAAEVASSSLDDGLPLKFLAASGLTAFSAHGDTKTLAVDKHQIMYPVLAGGTVRSSVTVQQGPDGKWQAVMFGRASVAKASHAVRLNVAAARPVDAGTLALIEVPALHAVLLSHTEKGVHMVTPVRDIPGTSYAAGATQPAAALFAALRPLAAKVNPAVPN